jgi:glutamine amidotransferase
VTTVAVVDYGAGNLASVVKGLEAAGAAVRIASLPSDVAQADALVVPGVGHFSRTAALGAAWRRAIAARVGEGASLLGICLGMQWLFDGSDEAPDVAGLGWMPGRCVRLSGDVKVPHVGWNQLDRQRADSVLLAGVPDATFAYFTHTFAVPAADDAVAITIHGGPFASVVERGRVFGTQFHPEKSGLAGLKMLSNFVRASSETRPPGWDAC